MTDRAKGGRLAVVVVLFCVAPAAAAEPAYLWWEGEAPAETNFPDKSWFSASTFEDNRDKLSGGAWLSNDGKRKAGQAEAFAVYRIEVPAAGEYELWTRKFWKHGPFRWRFGDGQWKTCGRDIALADSVALKQHTCANWVHLGRVKLPAGRQRFELRLLAGVGESKTAAFDCFLLMPAGVPFAPRGKLKPGQASGLAARGWFAWEPGTDDFDANAALDLRSLNETRAGQSGFVRAEGDGLALADGSPVRFWGVNLSAGQAAAQRELVDYLARKLAKSGVNMVRYHSPLFAKGGDPARLDAEKLDDLHYLIDAMAREGIYTKVSFYFPLWFGVQERFGIEGFEDRRGAKPFGLIFFDPRMIEIHRAWLKQLLTTKNPYTGKPIARDPAVAMVEVLNEDSLFFWTFSRKNVPPVHWRRLEQRFGRWLAGRHGSLEEALKAIGGRRGGDDPSAGRAELLDPWFLTREGQRRSGVPRQRVSAQAAFLLEVQRGFYEQTVGYIKNDLGYGGLVSCSNWQTADAAVLDDLERYSYTAGDVIDRHGYFGGMHKGEGSSYSVRVGHRYQDASAITAPRRLPLQVVAVAGYPHIVSELGWPQPNRHRSEAAFLSACYGALQGIDGLFHFAVGTNTLQDVSIRKFQIGTPAYAGQFPAAALIYRKGYVAEGEPVAELAVDPAGLSDLRPSPLFADPSLDELRKADEPGTEGDGTTAVDPLAFLAGPVVRRFDADAATRIDRDALGEAIRRQRGQVVSVAAVSGQLRWDARRGLVGLNAPKAQGVCGRLDRSKLVNLPDVQWRCENEVASLLAVSLDDKPLSESARVLVQVMTEDRPYGFAVKGGRIADLGRQPFNVRRIDAQVKLAGRPVRTMRILDGNGYVRETRQLKDGAGWLVLPPEAIYVILER